MNYVHKDNGFAVTVLSETPNSVTFAPEGGGFVYRIPKVIFQEDFELKEVEVPRVWRIAVFELDEGVGKWLGYTDGSAWNGWATPWFTLAVAQQVVVAETAPTPESYTAYDPDKDCFFAVDLGERYDMRSRSIQRGDGSYERVYEVSDGWSWDEAREESARETPDYFDLTITSERDAKLFLHLLHEDGLLFHPEDDPSEISNGGVPLFTMDEVDLLRLRLAEVHLHLHNPCAYILWLGKRFEIVWVRYYGDYNGESKECPAAWFNENRGFGEDDTAAMDNLLVGETLHLGIPWRMVSIRRTQ